MTVAITDSGIHPPGWWDPDLDPEDDYFPQDNLEEKDFECGFVPNDGECRLMGSTHCEVECPYRDLFFRRGDFSHPNPYKSEETG